jgi:hypothetical protein
MLAEIVEQYIVRDLLVVKKLLRKFCESMSAEWKECPLMRCLDSSYLLDNVDGSYRLSGLMELGHWTCNKTIAICCM